jgi:SAM-dependent methyltransferase
MWPVRRILDPRFSDLARRIDYARDSVSGSTQASVATLGERQDRLEGMLAGFGTAATESLSFVGGQMRDLEAVVGDLDERIEQLHRIFDPVWYARKVDALVGAPVAQLDGDSGRLIDYSQSHRGFAAQRELWLNPPLTISHREGDVVLGDVNERIVEVPFAFRALRDVAPPAAVLDVGCVESTVALSLATLGYRTCALDLRPYPFAHPNLEVAVARLEDFEREPESFDAVLCISTLEHVGLGWYGEERLAPEADRRAMERLRTLLVPGGLIVLTVPFGRASVDAVQRTYDDEGLSALLEGLEVIEREVVSQRDDRTWELGPSKHPSARAVAMVAARRPLTTG